MIPEVGVLVQRWDENYYSDYCVYNLKDIFNFADIV